jgi:hypothetical protein
MSLRELMLAELERGLAAAREGHEIVPAWRILTPEGTYRILARFDPDRPQQRNQMLALVPRFMAWKMTTAFVLTAETWLGPQRTRSGEEAVLSIGVSRRERIGVIRRLRRKPALDFGAPEWLGADAIDETYFRLLPAGVSRIMAEETAMLAIVFGENGEIPARRMN